MSGNPFPIKPELPYKKHFVEKRKDPIKRSIYAKLCEVPIAADCPEEIWPTRVELITMINSFYPDFSKAFKAAEDKGYEQCMQSWCRALDNRILNKRHLIDALVKTTRHLNDNEVAILNLKKVLEDDLATIHQANILGIDAPPFEFDKYIDLIKKVAIP